MAVAVAWGLAAVWAERWTALAARSCLRPSSLAHTTSAMTISWLPLSPTLSARPPLPSCAATSSTGPPQSTRMGRRTTSRQGDSLEYRRLPVPPLRARRAGWEGVRRRGRRRARVAGGRRCARHRRHLCHVSPQRLPSPPPRSLPPSPPVQAPPQAPKPPVPMRQERVQRRQRQPP